MGEEPRPALSGHPLADDEEEIRKLVHEGAEAIAKEDWTRAYDLLPPSAKDACPKDHFLLGLPAAMKMVKAAFGEEPWEALKEDAADGYDIRSIEVVPGGAIVYTVGRGDYGIEMVEEADEWWMNVLGFDPCDFFVELPPRR